MSLRKSRTVPTNAKSCEPEGPQDLTARLSQFGLQLSSDLPSRTGHLDRRRSRPVSARCGTPGGPVLSERARQPIASGPTPPKNCPTSHFHRRRYSRRIGPFSPSAISSAENGSLRRLSSRFPRAQPDLEHALGEGLEQRRLIVGAGAPHFIVVGGRSRVIGSDPGAARLPIVPDGDVVAHSVEHPAWRLNYAGVRGLTCSGHLVIACESCQCDPGVDAELREHVSEMAVHGMG